MSRIDIYKKLLSKAVNKHYIKRYVKFIESCKNGKTPTGYKEIHHILPKGEFPEFANFKENEWNSITLSLRQHFIAHMMLWKGIGKSQTFAFYAMINAHKIKINSKIYEAIKSDAFTSIGRNNSKITFHVPGTCDFIRLEKDQSPPDGYVRGSPLRKIQIYHPETHEQRLLVVPKFKEQYEIPEGWVVGNISSSKSKRGSSVWYDPITLTTKRVKVNENPPEGWLKGSPNTKSKKGKVAYYHAVTHEVKFFLPTDDVPEEFILGIPESKKPNKGMAVYKDADGKTYRLEKDSPLIKDYNLKGANSFVGTSIKCPFCDVVGSGGGMRKSHFKNCKNNPDNKS